MDNFELKIKRSNYLAIFLLFTHIGAVCCVLFLNFPIWLVTLLIILISYSCYINLRPAKKNIWTKDEIVEAGLRNDSFISQYLIILNFNKIQKPVVICPDSADKNNLRKLRVFLRNNYA